MDTKKLGDVVAIRPEFFKDRLQEHINVDLLKEQIEIHNLGLPMALKQAEQFIRGRVDTKKLGDVVAIRPEFFKGRLQEHINVDLLKEQIEIHNLGLPMALKQAEQFIRGRVDTKKLGDVVAIRPEFFKGRLQEHINVDLLKEQIEIYNLCLPIVSKQAEEFIIIYYYFLSIP